MQNTYSINTVKYDLLNEIYFKIYFKIHCYQACAMCREVIEALTKQQLQHIIKQERGAYGTSSWVFDLFSFLHICTIAYAILQLYPET